MFARAVAVAVAVAACLVGAAPAFADSTLSVTGTGRTFVTPDLATVYVGIHRSAPRASAARAAPNRVAGAVVAGIKRVGVPDAGIQSTDVSLSRVRVLVERRGHRHRVVRYFAADSLRVRAVAVSRAGLVIDAATRAGADEIGGPDFSFSDPSAGAREATRAALAAARARADDAAARLGYVVSGVRSVDLDPGQGLFVTADSGSSSHAPAAGSAPTIVKPGRQEVDASVRVVYRIAQRTQRGRLRPHFANDPERLESRAGRRGGNEPELNLAVAVAQRASDPARGPEALRLAGRLGGGRAAGPGRHTLADRSQGKHGPPEGRTRI